jgi:hypothetical protein
VSGAPRSRFDTATRVDPADSQPTYGDARERVVLPADTRPSNLSASGLSTTRTVAPGTSTTTPRAAAPITTPTDAASPVAEMVLTHALTPRGRLELPGQPLSLAQALERTTSSGQRIKAVQTYWKLVAKVAAYHAALDDQATFQNINTQQMPAHERSLLAAAQLAATAQVRRAELEFVTTQHELVEAAQLPSAEFQPLPSDPPLVSEYRTHFATLYGERAAPSGLRRLDRALPYHLQAVRAQADAVVAASRAMEAASAAVSNGQAGIDTLLNCHRLTHRERAAFMTEVFDYNAIIAEYALNVAPRQSPGTIVGMLIKTKPSTTEGSASIIADSRVIRTVSSDTPLPADAADAAPVLSSPNRFQYQAQPQSDDAQYDEPAAAAPVISQPPGRFQFNSSAQLSDEDDAVEPVEDGTLLLPRNDGVIYREE